MRIETKGISSHEALRPKDRGDLSLSVVELERWVVEATNWCNSSHFEFETLPVQLQYLETIITDQMRNILSLEGKKFLECVAAVKTTHSKMNSKFTRRVNFLETKKTSSTDWLEYSTMLYNNGKLADVNSMSYDDFHHHKVDVRNATGIASKDLYIGRGCGFDDLAAVYPGSD